MVLITHDNSIAVKAKRIVRLQDGRIIYDGDAPIPPPWCSRRRQAQTGRWAYELYPILQAGAEISENQQDAGRFSPCWVSSSVSAP